MRRGQTDPAALQPLEDAAAEAGQAGRRAGLEEDLVAVVDETRRRPDERRDRGQPGEVVGMPRIDRPGRRDRPAAPRPDRADVALQPADPPGGTSDTRRPVVAEE